MEYPSNYTEKDHTPLSFQINVMTTTTTTHLSAGDHHKHKHRRRVIAGLLLLCVAFFVLSHHPPTVTVQYEFVPSNSSPPAVADDEDDTAAAAAAASCDFSKGEWVPDPAAPYYTNETCWMIQEHQNCMKYGRTDTGYLRWRWQPEGCDLPRFDPAAFLAAMTGRKMAFVGDSLSRNHMQSLMCLLSKVAYPKDVSHSSNHDNRRMLYEKYNLTLSVFWSPYLVRYYDPDEENKFWRMYLDEVDQNWISQIAEYDYVIIGDGNWFARPSLYYERGKLVGCNYCQLPNVTELSLVYGNRKAFQTAFDAVSDSSNFEGILFLRTISPDHYENGDWNKGGNCNRTIPFKKGERKPTWLEGELYRGQVEEFAKAEKKGSKNKVVFRLLDTMDAMLRRPDGHPNSFGRSPGQKVPLRNDCVHWCLPGPIDAWNDILFRMIELATRGNHLARHQGNGRL